MSNDVAVVPVGLPNTKPVNRKPNYLILLESTHGKTKVMEEFLTLDKPELLNGFVQVKGFFTEFLDKNKDLSEVLTSTPSELHIEVMFPWHRIKMIKNLIFRAK